MDELNLYTEPTVFVLGAGASHCYGFPLGPELKNQILGYPDHDIASFLEDRKMSADLIPSFKEALTYGDYGTIDYFLERKKSYRELGAYYIVKVIASREQHARLFPQRELYADIFHMLNLESESKEIPPLSVVSLNYERSLEHFLVKNVQYNCSDEMQDHARAKVKRLPIVHAHGSLGDIHKVPYGKVGSDAASIEEAARQIKIISDRLEDSDDFHLAQKTIAEAHNIVFLGFGYNQRTLEALLSKSDRKTKRVFGTAFQFPRDQIDTLKNIFSCAHFHFGNFDEQCEAFLKSLGIGREKTQR